MSKNNSFLDDSKPLRVRRGRVESVDLYEIKDTELDILEKGTPAELQLNFAVFLISIAFTAISSLITAEFPNKVVQTLFIVISVVGILIGAYLLMAWSKTRSAVKSLCKKIRERIPPESLLVIKEDSDGGIRIEDDPDEVPSTKG